MSTEEGIQFIREWLAFARENLMSAKALVDREFAPFHTVCFLSQGSAEKYLKAYLLCHGWELKRTHDLSELLKLCSNFDASYEQLASECQLLNEYVVEDRYPGDLPFGSITQQDAEEAIESAEKIEAFVLSKVDPDVCPNVDKSSEESGI
jgi:HEPN domain-containing protein